MTLLPLRQLGKNGPFVSSIGFGWFLLADGLMTDTTDDLT
jgi:hypothetical protein